MGDESWVGWHLPRSDCRLNHIDNYRSGSILRPGTTVCVTGDIVPCKNGLHAATRLLDALKSEPGTMLCRVTLSGRIVEYNDWTVASERTILWMLDIREILEAYIAEFIASGYRLAGGYENIEHGVTRVARIKAATRVREMGQAGNMTLFEREYNAENEKLEQAIYMKRSHDAVRNRRNG